MYPSLDPKKIVPSPIQHPPVILLLGKRRPSADRVDQWLAQSRFCAFEAEDAFQALEQISDFTLPERPDVVYIHVDSIPTEHEFMQALVGTAPGEPDVPIIDFADAPKTNDEQFENAIAGLVCRLDELIPKHDSAKA